MHQKFRGSGIEIKSNNEFFNTFIEKWWDITNSEKKWSQFIFSLLITGSAIMELQYTPQDGNKPPRMGNIEQIPMQTIFRLFRDQFANELKIVQIVDGVFKELDPQFFIHQTINNPDRQAFGKSMFNTLASPRPITGTIDSITGDPINAERNTIPLLDAQARIQSNQIEIIDKMAKPRLIVGANGMSRDQMEEVQAEMADPNTDKYIWIFDKPVVSAELQIQAQGKFEDYTKGVDDHISTGTIFANTLITNPQGLSYSGGQAPLDILDQRMADLQTELIETIIDRVLKPLAESWGFKDFNAMEVKVSFIPTMKRLTMEDISGLDPEAVSKAEKRELYKKLNIPLDDQLWDKEQQELKQDKQDEKNIQMQAAMMGVDTDGSTSEDGEPFKPKEDDNGKPKTSGSTSTPEVPEASQFEPDRPAPTPTAQPNRKPKGESIRDEIIRRIAIESTMTAEEKIEAIKAVERIPLPPSAASNSNSSSDLYVSQGIDDIEGKPEITDPAIRDEFGLDKDEEELPPSAPSKMAHAGDRPTLEPADNTGGRFTNSDNVGIPQIPEVSEDEYIQHLNADNGNAHQGGTGNDGITSDSDGSFKDPIDANNDMERTPETGNTAIPNPHAGPVQDPIIDDERATTPDDMVMKVSGGSDPLPNNTKDQIIGGNDDDENPVLPNEGDPRDNDEEEKKILQDRQNIDEAVKPTIMEKPKMQVPEAPNVMHRDIIEGEDPFTSGTGDEQTPELNNQPQKGQARLDDTPLQDPSANKGNIDGINPTNNTTQELPEILPNDDDESPINMVPPFDKTSDNLGDSSQVRLEEEEKTGLPQDQPLENDSNNILDNTGLNVKPELRQVSEDDYNKKVQDGSNPLEQRGEPLQDGMVIKPEDTQQMGGIDIGTFGDVNDSPLTPDGITAHDQDPNTINDPTDSGIEEEEVDPNILHTDPETGISYTDLTDEQGEEVPDLRFDQTATSDEEQPEVEPEYEIVTKDEYNLHLDVSKGQQQDALSMQTPEAAMGEINEEPVPFGEDQPLDPSLDPVETDMDGEPVELPMADDNINDSIPSVGDSNSEEVPETGNDQEEGSEPEPLPSTTEKPEQKTSDDTAEPKKEKPEQKTSQKSDSQKSEKPKEKSTPKKPKEEEKPKKSKSPSKKEEPKEEGSKDKEESGDDETPKRSGTVKDIIKRERELVDSGVPDEELEEILEDEFGEKKVEKAKETKTWKKGHE